MTTNFVPEAITNYGKTSEGIYIPMAAELNGSYPVAVQDQTTNPIIEEFNKVTNQTTLASEASRDATSITVSSATGISVGSHIVLFSATTGRFMSCKAVSIASSPSIAIFPHEQ